MEYNKRRGEKSTATSDIKSSLMKTSSATISIALEGRKENCVSGVRVVDSEDCGRVAVATKAFVPGNVVFRESPAIVFVTLKEKDHEYHGLFESFLKASPQAK
jgi:hypothetical protein